MTNAARFFRLFASCIIVRGKAVGLIYDIERGAFYEIQHSFADLLEMTKQLPVQEIKARFDYLPGESIDAFFNHFVANELGFYTNEPAAYPELDLTWESPWQITNSVIEIHQFSEYDVEDALGQLGDLGCRAIQIRTLDTLQPREWEWMLGKVLEGSRINYAEVLLPHSHDLDLAFLFHLIRLQPRVNKILCYGAPEDRIINTTDVVLQNRIIWLAKDIRTDSREIIRKERFSTNIVLITEAMHYNAGLNRKISIDRNGEIRNYLNHPDSFGNVKTFRIADILQNPVFKEKWYLNNDRIEIYRAIESSVSFN